MEHYITDDDNLSIQSRNISTTHLYWWRLNQYNDNQKTKTIVKELRKQVKNSMSLITRAMTGFIGVVLGLNYYQNLLKMDSGRNAIEKQIKDRVLSLQSIE